MKIYTRTGDSGDTALFDGTRVSKRDPRVAAYGEIDELNAWLGFALSQVTDPQIRETMLHIQRDLFALGARLADPSHRIADRVRKATILVEDVKRLEDWIDRFEGELPPLRRFILPGGAGSGALLHVARVVCRRAERAVVELGPSAIEPELLQYINRLSDLFFTLARVLNSRAGVADVEW